MVGESGSNVESNRQRDFLTEPDGSFFCEKKMSKKLLAHALCAYIGTKSVLATTMTRGEYNEYRGWQIPENEDPSEQGYLVEYVDGGKPNDERHKGYISWSPRDVFEQSYHQAQTPQDRVRLEQRDLYDKLDKLENFLDKLLSCLCGSELSNPELFRTSQLLSCLCGSEQATADLIKA